MISRPWGHQDTAMRLPSATRTPRSVRRDAELVLGGSLSEWNDTDRSKSPARGQRWALNETQPLNRLHSRAHQGSACFGDINCPEAAPGTFQVRDEATSRSGQASTS